MMPQKGRPYPIVTVADEGKSSASRKKASLHMMSHSLAFQKFTAYHKRSDSRASANSSAMNGRPSNGANATSGNLNSTNNNVHMAAMRPRTFDPKTMKSARRKVNLQKHCSQERHFQQMVVQNFATADQANYHSIFDTGDGPSKETSLADKKVSQPTINLQSDYSKVEN